jgi:hypothetical protein
MTSKTPHYHAEFLAEAVLDTSRSIQGKHIYADFWQEVTLSSVTASNELWEFRFTDTVKPKIVSSLTDNELYAIVAMHNLDKEDIDYLVVRAVADAAAAKQHADMAPPDLRVNHPSNSLKAGVKFPPF